MDTQHRFAVAARMRRAAAAALAGGTLALAAAAPAATAQEGHSLALSGPPAATAGNPIVLQATGVVPDDVFLNRYLNVYAIPAAVVGSCPATYQSALQIKDNTGAQGGETVALSVPAEGSFAIPVAYTPRTAGRFLLCGYVHEGVETMAVASHALDVGSDSPGATRPAIAKKPKVSRSGRKLVCSRGTWAGSPTGFSYQWRVNGKRKAGAKGRTLRITPKLRGRKVRCGVTARNAAGSATVLSGTLKVK